MIGYWKEITPQKSGSELKQTLWTSYRELSLVRSLTFDNMIFLRTVPAIFHILQQSRDDLFFVFGTTGLYTLRPIHSQMG